MHPYRSALLLCVVSFCVLNVLAGQENASDSLYQQPVIEIDLKEARLSQNSNYQLALELGNELDGEATVHLNGTEQNLVFSGGRAPLELDLDRRGRLVFFESSTEGGPSYKLYHLSERQNGRKRIVWLPLWLSILPPLVAIVLALIFREVIISLFMGIWAGAFIAGGLRVDSIYYFFISVVEVVEKYVVNALIDSGHMAVIIFSLLIGGMVAIISKNGGMAGVVLGLSRFARTTRSSQFITWLLGIAIFFDDYANTLIVGNTMRSVTDRFKISREKLAYIVDSTAAPVSAIAFITTWIGAELGYIGDGIGLLRDFEFSMSPYSIFIDSLKYSFYPILTLSFVLLIIYLKREFGPMYKAELRARSTGQVSPASTIEEDEPNMESLEPVKGAPLRWQNAFFPVLTVILLTIFGLLQTGMEATLDSLLSEGIQTNGTGWGAVWAGMVGQNPDSSFFTRLGTVIGNADSYIALLWASASGVILAVILTVSQRIIRLFDTMHHLVTGFKTMLPALIILTLAWALAITTVELHTATYITTALEGNVSPFLLPMIVFVLASFIAFSTGSSWSTMAILYPIAIPTTWAVSLAAGLDPQMSLEILLNVIATVLAASVLGDHCSPISDTTILSSLASDCNHIDHVRTQLPYAVTVGLVALGCCGLSTFLGGGWLVSFVLLLVGLAVLYLVLLRIGKPLPVDE